jgi:hypothetical protein
MKFLILLVALVLLIFLNQRTKIFNFLEKKIKLENYKRNCAFYEKIDT